MVKLMQDTYTTFKTVFIGMGVTLTHFFKKSVTVQYPEQRDVLPERVRLKLHVNIDDCIGCRLCERACPVECITIGTIKSTDDDDLGETSTGHKKKLWVNEFDIDMAKCCYCELCVHPCPTNCITMVEDYEYSAYDRNDLILSFSDMTADQIERAQQKLQREEEEKQKKKEAARLAKEQNKSESSSEGPASGSAAGTESGTGKTEKTASDESTTDHEKYRNNSGIPGTGNDDAEKEARRAAREERRAKRKAEREAKKKE